MDKAHKILIISSEKELIRVLHLCFTGWGYKVSTHNSVVRDVTYIKKISPDVIVVDVHSANKANLEICTLIKEDFITAFIPVITLIDKRQLRMQLLNLKQGVDDYLIKPPDPLDLRARIEMAIRRSQYSFYASPLTGLPGGRIIEEVVKEKIKEKKPFSFGYLDIDNFKYFNDIYGYVKGDRVIMQTAYTLYTVIKKYGNNDDFIGHIGGDDFVFITTPERCRDICHNFILAFDRIIPFHYSGRDREQGFIMARDRTHKIKRMGFMTVSIAVVHREMPGEFHNIIEINEKIAEIKQYLKNIASSKFMADRRDSKIGGYLHPAIYKKEQTADDSYKPLGQMLLEKDLISAEQLDEALTIHWKRGIIFGEILKELGFVKEQELDKVLSA